MLGIVLFFAVGWSLRSLERAKRVRYLAAGLGVALLLFNLVFGREQYGARNWIFIGPLSFQPSEIVKVCFVFVGASTMDRIVSRRNLVLFILYSGFICGCLVLISDFGAALIFFAAFLVIAFLRSGSFATVALACAAVSILVIQTILNVFGTMDLLPLTGVTFPFVSNGGSSMLSSWGLIAFIKAADTRQNASFAVRMIKAEEVQPYE